MSVPTPTAVSAGVYTPRVVREWLSADPSPDLRHRRLEGSMVFSDVSGFTKMSERLARFGKVGAEAVTDIIQTCFSRLLDEAYSYDGTLLQFGGDALLLFYQGDDHAKRAAASALGIRRALREMRGFETEAGKIDLNATIGVNTGGFDFFLVGSSHRQLVVGGPAASHLVELEGAAEKGRILVGDATARGLSSRNVGPLRGPGRLLRGSIDVPRQAGVEFLRIERDMSDTVAVGLRRAVETAEVSSEHRTATIAFIHFMELDQVIAQHGPAEAGRRLHALMCGVQRSIDDRGICFQSADVGTDGGKFYLSVGAPLSTGHDEEQMLLALREIVELDVGLPLRAGANSGPVFTGEIGTVHLRTYTTMGDAVNLAARVMSKADVGHLYATQPVLDRSRTLFATQAIPPFMVKGKSKPVIAHSVGPANGVRAAIASADLPLVGRDHELELFLDAVEATVDNRGGLIELVAGPGAGKSRLLEQYVIDAEAANLTVHRVKCRLYQASTPYFVFQDFLRDLFGLTGVPDDVAVERLRAAVVAADPAHEQWLSLIAVPFGLEVEASDEVRRLDDEFRKAQLVRSVTSLLDHLLDEPTMVCIEDTHWMDDASSELLEAIVDRLRERPLLVVLTRRDAETGFLLPDEHVGGRIVLEPLGPDALHALVVAVTPDAPLAPHVRAPLVERCDGNPMFLLELVQAVIAGGDPETLPTSIEGLITARIDRLRAGDRAMLRHMSVLGAGFDVAYVPSVLPESLAGSVDDSLQRLDEFVTLDDTGLVAFRHNLVRDVAYGGLPLRTRSELHGRVADSLFARVRDAVEGEAPLLSLHCHAAHRFPESWRFSVLAGDQAREVFANIDAATFYGRALDAARRLPELPTAEWAQVLDSLGDVQDLAGLCDDARNSYAAGRRLLRSDSVRCAELNLKTAFIDERLGRYGNAMRSLRAGQRLLESLVGSERRHVTAMRARLAVWSAVVRIGQGRYAEAAEDCEVGIRLAEEACDESTLAQGYVTADHANASLGRSHGHDRSQLALDIYIRLGDPRGEATAANMLGTFAYYEGRWDEAAEFYRRSRDARERMGDPANAAVATANLAELLVDQGRIEEAAGDLRDVEALWSSTGDEWGVAFSRRLQGIGRARTGGFDLADALLTQARTTLDDMGAKGEVVGTDVCVAELRLLEGRPEQALDLLDALPATDLAKLGCHHLVPTIHRLRGLALAATGRDGTEALWAALDAARERHADHEIALALDALAAVDRTAGRPVDAERQDELFEIATRLGIQRRLAPG